MDAYEVVFIIMICAVFVPLALVDIISSMFLSPEEAEKRERDIEKFEWRHH